MATISITSLQSKLINRTDAALRAADANGDGAVDASERATLPEDVRPLADSTANQYLSGGAMGIDSYLSAYGDYVKSSLDTADKNQNGKLTNPEQKRLPAEIYGSVLALRAGTSTTPTTPTTPTT